MTRSVPRAATLTSGRHVDSYHSCYNLAGLSSAQNHYYYIPTENTPSQDLTASFQWKAFKVSADLSSTDKPDVPIFEEQDRVALIHPVFVVPWGAAERARAYFEAKPALSVDD